MTIFTISSDDSKKLQLRKIEMLCRGITRTRAGRRDFITYLLYGYFVAVVVLVVYFAVSPSISSYFSGFIIGSMMSATVIMVALSIHFFSGKTTTLDPPKLECPNCEAILHIYDEWECQNCFDKNNTFLTSAFGWFLKEKEALVFDGCSSCGVKPPAIVCRNCDHLITTGFDTLGETNDYIIQMSATPKRKMETLSSLVAGAVENKDKIENIVNQRKSEDENIKNAGDALRNIADTISGVPEKKEIKSSPLDEDLK